MFRAICFVAALAAFVTPASADPASISLAFATIASNAAAAVGASVAAQATIALAASTFGPIALAVGLSVVASLLNRPQQPKPSDVQSEFRQAIPTRMFHYGRVKVSGPLADLHSLEPDLYKIVLISSGEIDAYEQLWLNDERVTTDPTDNFVQQSRYNPGGDPKVVLVQYRGTSDQLADSMLTSSMPDRWTADHQLRGIAYIAGKFTQSSSSAFNEVYPERDPRISALIRGARVYDPRLGSGQDANDPSTWTWSDNAALAVLHYLISPDGYNRPIANINLVSFATMADICDEAVTLKAGGTEPRYRVASTISLSEPRKDVLARLLEACDGRLQTEANGRWGIRGGEWEAPTVTLDAELGHIIDAHFSAGPDAMEEYNELSISYLSPAHGYVEVEGEAWQDAGLVAAMGGVVETRPLDLVQVPSHGQARRLAKQRIKRDNPAWVGQIRTNLYGLNCITERVITVRWPELEIDGPFWIDGEIELLEDGTGCLIPVRSADPTAYDWDAATEEGDAPPVPPMEGFEDRGPEIVTNGGFDSDTIWTKGTGWTIVAGVASRTNTGSASILDQPFTPQAGVAYEFTFTVVAVTSGSVAPGFTGGTAVSGTARSAPGTYTETIVAVAGNNELGFGASATFAGSIDDVSVKEIFA